MTHGEMLSALRVPLCTVLNYVQRQKWNDPTSDFNAWRDGGKPPGYDTIDVDYVIDCVQVRWCITSELHGAIDIFYDRVVFVIYCIETKDIQTMFDLKTFLKSGLTEENLFQYDVAYGLDGITEDDIVHLCRISRYLVEPSEQTAYAVEMGMQL